MYYYYIHILRGIKIKETHDNDSKIGNSKALCTLKIVICMVE